MSVLVEQPKYNAPSFCRQGGNVILFSLDAHQPLVAKEQCGLFV